MARQLVIWIFVHPPIRAISPELERGFYSLLRVGPRSALIWCLRILLGILLKHQQSQSVLVFQPSLLWRGSCSRAYGVDCTQIRPDLSIVPFWPVFCRSS